jgi:hypothetical protein
MYVAMMETGEQEFRLARVESARTGLEAKRLGVSRRSARAQSDPCAACRGVARRRPSVLSLLNPQAAPVQLLQAARAADAPGCECGIPLHSTAKRRDAASTAGAEVREVTEQKAEAAEQKPRNDRHVVTVGNEEGTEFNAKSQSEDGRRKAD